jgi:ABC-type branched-subunit amino acid transport system ATPase component
VLSVVGRNGMGKTTLCKAIVGLIPVASGSIRFMGEELVGRSPAEIARLGLGYVPQGRRLWPSLTVDEHLRLAAGGNRSQWTIPRIYEAFPRLAERRTNRGNQLSGGEQQMLAVSRALLLNPRLLIMDEPTEGLAPVIVEQVEEILVTLGEQGDIGVFVVEQNIGVATAVAEKVAIMINGRVNRVMEASLLAADRELQQRLLGVGQHGEEESVEEAIEEPGPQGERRSPKARGPVRVYISNPNMPTRWSQPVPVAQIETAARTRTVAPEPAVVATAPAVELRPMHRGGVAPVIVAGTLDTKGDELRFIRDQIATAGVRVLLVDLSTSGKPSPADVPPHHVAAYFRGGPNAVFTGDRGAAITAMAAAFEAWIRRQGPHYFGGRIGSELAGGACNACAADRRAQNPHLLGRFRQRRALRRTRRYHDALFRDRRCRAQFGDATDSRQRCRGNGRHGEGARRSRRP